MSDVFEAMESYRNTPRGFVLKDYRNKYRQRDGKIYSLYYRLIWDERNTKRYGICLKKDILLCFWCKYYLTLGFRKLTVWD